MGDTPRTTAALDATEPSNIRECNMITLCYQLERELSQLKSENDRLREMLTLEQGVNKAIKDAE